MPACLNHMVEQAAPTVKGDPPAAAVAPAAAPPQKKGARSTSALPDRPIPITEYTTPTAAPELAASMSAVWTPAQLEAYLACLPLPPDYTCFRVNTLACPDVDAAAAQLQGALAPFAARLAASGRGDHPVAVRRHPLLPDILLVHSAPPEPALAAGISSSPFTELTEPEDGALLHVVVGRLCGEAVLRGADVYACGVLVASNSMWPGTPVALWCDLDNAVLRGSELRDYRGTRVLLGRGVARLGRADIFRLDHGLAVEVSSRLTGDAPSVNGVLEDLLRRQSLPSAVVGHVLGARPGEAVLDMCAAPGGKTSHIACTMEGKGLLVAVDRSEKKAVELREVLAQARAGPDFACILAMDSRKLIKPQASSDPRALVAAAFAAAAAEAAKASAAGKPPPLCKIAGFGPSSFDRILLDGPCSALGQRPRLRIDFTPTELAGFAAVQRRLAQVAVGLLKPGGTLVYSTCTVNPLENEAMVAYILGLTCARTKKPLMELVPAVPRVGAVGLQVPEWALEAMAKAAAGSEDVRGGSCGGGAGGEPQQQSRYGGAGQLVDSREEGVRRLTTDELAMVQRFDPGAALGGDSIGFFCAKFKKFLAS